MDHWKGLSTVFNCWNFRFIAITQWWATVDIVTQNGPIFYEIFKIFVVINQKLCDVCGQKLIWVVSTIGTTNTISFVKIREVTQNSLLILHGMTLQQDSSDQINNSAGFKLSRILFNKIQINQQIVQLKSKHLTDSSDQINRVKSLNI